MHCSLLVSTTSFEYNSKTKHCNADKLSRLPLQQKEREETEVDSSEVIHATQFEQFPVTSEAAGRETHRDLVLARVYESIVKGWSARVDGDKPYYKRHNELMVHRGCILWGMRVVIPHKLQDSVGGAAWQASGFGKDESTSEELPLVA